MRAEARRREIIGILECSDKPVPGGALSKMVSVSRQIIVQDIATLKAAGYDIMATHNGYVLKHNPLCERVFKLKHTSAETEDELMTIVKLGGTVVDVFVSHLVYGKMEARLNIFSESDVAQFIEGIKVGKSSELMNITSGFHYHTVRAAVPEALDVIEKALQEKGYLVPEN